MYLPGVSDLETFHLNLLGRDPARTPERYHLTELQKRFYSAAEKGVRGVLFDTPDNALNPELFVATFVVAFKLTQRGDTLIACTTRSVSDWVGEQINLVARHIFSSRKKATKKDIQVLYESFQKLVKGTRVLQRPEPMRWVAFGFTKSDVMPVWMRKKVLSL